MKLLFKTSALVFALAVSCSVAVAQVTPGSSPLSIARGGTGANTAAGARAASGLNIDELTSHGDSNYSIASTDRTVATSTTLTAPRTWTLPAASSVNPGQHLYIQDFKGFVSGTNTLTIGRNGSDTINGGTGSQVINTANGGFLFISDGVSNWSAQALGAQATPGAVSSFNTLTGAVTTNVVFQKFLTTGTYTPTTGMLHAIVECIGSGGGGGVTGSAGGIFVGAGGESGSYSMKRIAATDIVGTATVTIGALGSGGAAGNNSGSAGSDVTVVSNSVTLCAGGFTNTTTIGRGGASAVSGTGDVTAIGSPGDGSFYNSANLTTVAPSGRGGSSALGGGGTTNFCGGGTTAAGAAAGNYGSGGAGACVSNGTGTAAGGNGSAGTVIITEFVNM